VARSGIYALDLWNHTEGPNDILARLILWRGIPYGGPLPDGAAPRSPESNQDLGLLFSIERLEFLATHGPMESWPPMAGSTSLSDKTESAQHGGLTAELPTAGSPSKSLGTKRRFRPAAATSSDLPLRLSLSSFWA
jgi:hypothetical protein